ncbi:DUF397 domain-containing protein [Streptomyces bohaiensis]|uniref:DUF397 domain-containing protein n=1 Tax=Streptomyces bohaiensis TaxID=1431344 RepID=A0ABX1CCS4_9ACTN|nr:DUF397 domain-containing protein [Streptomyces bohaiensis]NJQ16906.1 DUF397 domain-containing protein [Streptomyces bohaiensis]
MITSQDRASAEWIRSSYSDGSGGQCVEFSRDSLPRTVPVRDSKNAGGDVLELPAVAWSAFTSAVRRQGLSG